MIKYYLHSRYFQLLTPEFRPSISYFLLSDNSHELRFNLLYGLALTKKIPVRINRKLIKYEKRNTSPSTTPHIIATTGDKYVTEEAKTGLLILINLLKTIKANPVPTMERINK